MRKFRSLEPIIVVREQQSKYWYNHQLFASYPRSHALEIHMHRLATRKYGNEGTILQIEADSK